MSLRGGSRLISPAEKDLTTDSNDSGKQGHGVILGLSAGTIIITKVTKKPNNRTTEFSPGLHCLVALFLLLYINLKVQLCKEAGLNNKKACMAFP